MASYGPGFDTISACGRQTNGRIGDRRTDGIAVASTALAKRFARTEFRFHLRATYGYNRTCNLLTRPDPYPRNVYPTRTRLAGTVSYG